MTVRWLFAMLLVVMTSGAPALAQDHRPSAQLDYADARRQLRDLRPAEQVQYASQQCQRADQDRRLDDMGIWCRVAIDTAHSRRRAIDDQTSLAAAWIAMADFMPRSTRSTLARLPQPTDAASALRWQAYLALAAQRSGVGSCGCPEIGAILGIAQERRETIAHFRDRLLDSLLAQERTPERLWAIAAIGGLGGVAWRSDTADITALRADALAVAARISTVAAEAPQHEGQDRALRTALRLAHGLDLLRSRSLAEARDALDQARQSCVEDVGPYAQWCRSLSFLHAQVRIAADDFAAHPELIDTVLPRKVGSATFVGDVNSFCAALVVGDVADDGKVINARVEYADPVSCGAAALSYAQRVQYVPLTESGPNERRQNVTFNVRMTPEY